MMEGYAILSLLLCLSVASAYSNYDVRLAGTGSSERMGRVEVFLGGEWGTVCDDDWGYDDADVVCRQLGYHEGASGFTTNAREFGQGSGNIFLDDVSCKGYEDRITDCEALLNTVGETNCGHDEDAGVKCQGCTVDSDCEQDGICNVDMYCACQPGYFGENCEDGCTVDSDCEQDGICNEHKLCDCQPGYYGPNCRDVNIFTDSKRQSEDVEFYLKKEEQMAAEEESNDKKEADLKKKDFLQALYDLLAELNDK
ncbi:neurotrypsin-like isoform X2 [Strongylocentrotus purpuratus]|uniref:Uncharacterized protein n=1 Tax=Strongylocentrotus purpuratus TaxID=7668 RepID=A0A7M7P0U2_STRPU|nr:neurotrypsin-like isoform X2 [Strongylocentrotus purpuratus]